MSLRPIWGEKDQGHIRADHSGEGQGVVEISTCAKMWGGKQDLANLGYDEIRVRGEGRNFPVTHRASGKVSPSDDLYKKIQPGDGRN